MTDTTCTVSDCATPPSARGWCRKHYKRWVRNGHPEKLVRVEYGKYVICEITGCDRPHTSKGLCSIHLGRLKNHGDPLAEVNPRMRGSLADRLAFRSDPQPNGCLHWTGCIMPTGYGQMGVGDRKKRLVHVVAYEIAKGPVPEGLDVDHVCHNADPGCVGGHACLHRRCVNPDHLEAVSRLVNVRRANARRGARPDFCEVDGCGRPHAARGWCGTHYLRWRTHGDVMADVPIGVQVSP